VTSERQKAANRANAQHSTGPKTPEGKAVVRLTPMRHGLLAHDVVLPEEDAEAFEHLFNQVRSNLSPVGPIEKFLVDHVVNTMWRLRRLARAEIALFYSRIEGLKANRIEKEVASYGLDGWPLCRVGPTHARVRVPRVPGGNHFLGVGHKVQADIAAVELHAHDHLEARWQLLGTAFLGLGWLARRCKGA
jgi:hypothetical protein